MIITLIDSTTYKMLVQKICSNIITFNPTDMANMITLVAERKNHKSIKIEFFNTSFGKTTAQHEKENLERRGYTVTIK